ncbi:MAG: ATP-binding cassette domain-containing protein [Candidatus Izimaplasma sp.]|nr:ATP-binding cassette domain-containing protein [Candidatus Izimaplasma bacterium]
MIETTGLVVKYKNITFKFDDYHFEKNKVSVISGRNGAGKTTLLKSIASLIKYEGNVKVNGEITYNSQEAVIFNRSVYENIVYPLRIRKLDLSLYQDKIIAYSKVLSIEHLLDKNALKLSSGEKMKVSIVRSIIFNPEIVLLDEPTTHLDLESINELSILIKELKKKITFIVVSHNKTFIEELIDEEYYLGGCKTCLS